MSTEQTFDKSKAKHYANVHAFVSDAREINVLRSMLGTLLFTTRGWPNELSYKLEISTITAPEHTEQVVRIELYSVP